MAAASDPDARGDRVQANADASERPPSQAHATAHRAGIAGGPVDAAVDARAVRASRPRRDQTPRRSNPVPRHRIGDV